MATFPKVRVAEGQATTTQVNAGLQIVPPVAGHTITVVDGWLRAIGGAAGGTTSVDITDTASSPATAFTMAAAGLTQNAVARVGLATHSTNTNVGTPLTKGAGLKIIKNGSNLTTATAVDYCILYKIDG